MIDYPSILLRLGIHAIVASPLLYIGVQAKAGLASPFVLLGAALIMGYPLARLFGELLTHSLMSGGRRMGKAPPNYSLVEAAVQRGNYAQAMELYEGMMESHPQELKVYKDAIKVAHRRLGDEARVNQVLSRALKNLPAHQHDALMGTYHRTISS